MKNKPSNNKLHETDEYKFMLINVIFIILTGFFLRHTVRKLSEKIVLLWDPQGECECVCMEQFIEQIPSSTAHCKTVIFFKWKKISTFVLNDGWRHVWVDYQNGLLK